MFWRWLVFTGVFLNVLILASGHGSSWNWIGVASGAVAYFILSAVHGYRMAQFANSDIADLLPTWVVMENFGSAISLAGWAAHWEAQGAISNKPFLEFGPIAFHSAPEALKKLANKNPHTLCYEVWI
jgi:hypothetical protein